MSEKVTRTHKQKAAHEKAVLYWQKRAYKAEAERDEYKRNFEAELEGNRTLALEMGDKRDNETMRDYCKRVAYERDRMANFFNAYAEHKPECQVSIHGTSELCDCGLAAIRDEIRKGEG